MSIEKAFSLEIQKQLTALKANSLRRQNILHDPKAFICAGSPDCKVELTCVNFSKKPSEWVQAPHFRLSNQLSNHSNNCSFFKKETKGKNCTQPRKTTLNNKGNFNLILNSTGFNKPQPSNPVIRNNANNTTTVTTYVSTSSTNLKNINSINSEISSLRKLIDVYNSDDYDNSKTKVTVGSKTLCLDELFINFDSSKEIKLDSYSYVYYGKAIIIERNNTNPFYIVRFTKENQFVSDSDTIKAQASFLVFKNQIQKHRHLKSFEKHVNSKPILCYIYGRPEVRTEKYINFKLENYHNILLKQRNRK